MKDHSLLHVEYRVQDSFIPAFVEETTALRVDRDNVIRVGRTRVTLDTLITVYEQGYSPEEIVESFNTLDPNHVCEVIVLYHRHHREVRSYLEEGERIGEEIRRHLKPVLPSRDFKDRIVPRSNADP